MYTVTIMIIHAELTVLNVRELCLSHSDNVALACTITYVISVQCDSDGGGPGLCSQTR